MNIKEAIKYVISTNNLLASELKTIKDGDRTYIFNESQDFIFKLENGLLKKAQNVPTMSPVEENQVNEIEDVFNGQFNSVNENEEYLEDVLQDTKLRSDLSHEIADKLFEDLDTEITQRNPAGELAFLNEGLTKKFFMDNLFSAVEYVLSKNSPSLSGKEDDFIEKNKLSIWMAFNAEASSRASTLLNSVQGKSKGGSKTKESKSIYIDNLF